MKSVWIRILGLAIAPVLVVALSAPAQDKPPQPPAAPQPEQTPEMAAAMEAWMKSMTPGPNHDLLKPMIGDWVADVKFRMSPDAPEQTSQGYTRNELIFGGRFIKQEYGGDMMGQPFHGMGLMGYDNVKKKFVAIWADEMSTAIIMAEGTADASGKVITFTGEAADPMSGQDKKYKQVTTIIDADKHVSAWYDTAPDGKEVKNMEITYTRKK